MRTGELIFNRLPTSAIARIIDRQNMSERMTGGLCDYRINRIIQSIFHARAIFVLLNRRMV